MINDISLKTLTADSREVKPGALFVAMPGLTQDGREYIQDAIQKGAVAVLMETAGDSTFKASLEQNSFTVGTVPIIPIPNLRALLGSIAGRFFANPSEQFPVMGITGTNGKTSVSFFIAQILTFCSIPCGVMGTLGAGFIKNLDSNFSTHQDAIAVQKTLAEIGKAGAKAVAMEATSHALTQGRVAGVNFHTVIFTNLTRDHLDYHGDMKAYGAAKQKLFTEFNPKFSVINLEDEFGCQLWQEEVVRPVRQCVGYTTEPEPRRLKSLSLNSENLKTLFITTHNLVLDESGMTAGIQTPWGEGQLRCQLLGRFNLSNLLAALAAACLQGIPLERVLAAIESIKTVPGRMMRFGGKHNLPLVVVDYAHTPDALAQVLQALRAHCKGRLWCVFGCGGDRDRGKRPFMASVVEALSDVICLTQDNSRTEDPKQIFSDMLLGLKNPENATVEYDRKQAIFFAIQNAQHEDIVLIAGKGHENMQLIGTDKILFSDSIVVEEALNLWRAA